MQTEFCSLLVCISIVNSDQSEAGDIFTVKIELLQEANKEEIDTPRRWTDHI